MTSGRSVKWWGMGLGGGWWAGEGDQPDSNDLALHTTAQSNDFDERKPIVNDLEDENTWDATMKLPEARDG